MELVTMPLIYRSMLIDGNKPKVGGSATTLGVRVPPAKDTDILAEADGTVLPKTGGMSVAPAWRRLPIFRISKRLRDKIEGASGSRNAFCWRMGTGPFVPGPIALGLALNVDSEIHGTVEPDSPMPLSEYQGKLAATRDEWVIDEE
jgi:hypothetical protein